MVTVRVAKFRCIIMKTNMKRTIIFNLCVLSSQLVVLGEGYGFGNAPDIQFVEEYALAGLEGIDGDLFDGRDFFHSIALH